MSPTHLETVASAVIRQTLQRLPETLRSAAADCMIETTLMSESQTHEEVLDEDLLGLFEGRTHAEDDSASEYADLPRIRLFLDNLWDYADCERSRYREEVRITLLHELGHYLGLDEDQVASLGLA